MMLSQPELYRTLSLTLDFTKNEIVANNLQPGTEYIITLQQKEREEVKLTYSTETLDTTTTTSTTTTSIKTSTEKSHQEESTETTLAGIKVKTTTASPETTTKKQALTTTMDILEDFISETRVQAETILKETEQLDFIEVERSQTDEELCNSEDRSFFEFCEDLPESKMQTTTEEMSRTARTLPIGYSPGKVEAGEVQSLADVSSPDYVNEGSGENEASDAGIFITLNEESLFKITKTKPSPTKSSTTTLSAETTTQRRESTKGRTHSRKNHRKNHHPQHETTTKAPAIQSVEQSAEPEFSRISTAFDSQESNNHDNNNLIIEPTVIPVNMEMLGTDQSMSINEIKRENEMMSIITASIAGVGGLVLVLFFALLLIHRIRKSDQGSYFIPWESAKTSGGLTFIDDSRASTVTGEELPEAISSLTPFLNRKGLDFSNPETVNVKNFDDI